MTARTSSLWGPENASPQAKQGIQAGTGDSTNTSNQKQDGATPRSSASFYRAQSVFNRRIHVLGMGSVGTFIAHSLRGIPNPPPVTLIFHSREKLNLWNESPKRLQLTTEGDTEKREGYEAELAIPRKRSHGKEIQADNTGDPFPKTSNAPASLEEPRLPEGESLEPIHSLMVCTKTPKVLQALSAVKHRLHKDSVICFLQNGMGTVEEVNREIFPDPETRPHYMLAINSHGMHGTNDTFRTAHTGFGTISLGILPHERDRAQGPYLATESFKADSEAKPAGPASSGDADGPAETPSRATFSWTPNHRYLLRTLLRTPVLSATAFSPPDLLQMQLEKLAVNCIINPMTVMLDARNGAVNYNYYFTRVMRLLLSEISLVIRSLPELQYIPNVQQRFDPGRLEHLVVGVANRTKNNISSMLADMRAGRHTEIDYINGWIVKRGEEQGIRCLMNYMLMHMVKGKAQMTSVELREGIPFVEGLPGEEDV